MDEYRLRLLAECERIQTQQRVKEMTDAELEAAIAQGLGLPPGTTFTTEQLKMIVRHTG